GADSQILVALADSTKPPLFLIHPVGGDVLCYGDLAQALRPDFSVYGLRARGLGGEPPFPSFGDMVATYVNEIRSVQPVGPYRVGGQSLGGIIALAVARMLEQSGEQVEQVLLLDTFSPAYLRDAYGSDADIMSAALGRNLAGVAPETAAGSEDYVQRMYRAAAGAGILPADVPEAVFHAIFRVAVNNHRLASQTEVESIRAKVHHFTAQDNPATVPSGKTWQNVGLDLVTHTVPGGHETLMQGPNAAPLARLISSLCK
ncbi:MAG: thioesterase domain-containing protein, partial [Gammaproteobacteria bacterium]